MSRTRLSLAGERMGQRVSGFAPLIAVTWGNLALGNQCQPILQPAAQKGGGRAGMHFESGPVYRTQSGRQFRRRHSSTRSEMAF